MHAFAIAGPTGALAFLKARAATRFLSKLKSAEISLSLSLSPLPATSSVGEVRYTLGKEN